MEDRMSETSRRGFIRGIGAGALAGYGPIILGAQNKSGSAKPILGEGDHKYEVTHDWGELPANIKYGNTHGVCEDSQAHIYVHHTVNDASESHDSMVVFDHQGKFVKSWGKEFQGGAHGLHIRKEGHQEFLYLCDTKRAIVMKTTLDGEEVFTLGYPKESEFYKLDKDGKPATKYSPTNLAIAPNGDIYVGDGYGSSYINQHNSKGEFIRTFGGKGKEPGQLDCPHGSTVGGVNLPCHFSERRGEFVIPDLGARVTLMDRENQVIANLGDDSAAKTWGELRKQTRDHFTPGKFVCPHGACFDHVGNILVVEWVEVGRVSRLRKVA